MKMFGFDSSNQFVASDPTVIVFTYLCIGKGLKYILVYLASFSQLLFEPTFGRLCGYKSQRIRTKAKNVPLPSKNER